MDTALLLCPVCMAYLSSTGPLAAETAKVCRSCGYTRPLTEASPPAPLISDDAGRGVSPIAGQPELLRPEERNNGKG